MKCWKFTMKPVKLEEVAVATDPKLSEAWEAKKAEARKSIRMARKQLTQEVQGWDRMLSKYEARVTKGEVLTQAGRTLIGSSAALSQERISTYLAVILSSLEELMTISGNCKDDADLDTWLDELLLEKESQTEVVAEGIDQLGDRTESIKAEFKRKMEAGGEGASGGASPRGGDQGGVRTYVYRSLDHMKPPELVKEIKPSELRTWKYKYDQWCSASFQGTVPPEVEVNTFMCFLDSWWQSRLRPRMRKETCLEDLWKFVMEEMKVMWPISIRRELLFSCKQKQGQAASDYYLELKAIGEDCELEGLGPEGIICHLLVRGLLGSEERLRERIIIDSEGGELRDKRLVNLITSSEVYRASTSKSARVSRGEVKGPRDKSEVRQRDKSKRGCFRCGDLSHFRANCTASVFCKDCNSDNHNSKTCWRKEQVKKASVKDKNKKSGRRGRRRVRAKRVRCGLSKLSPLPVRRSMSPVRRPKGKLRRRIKE